MPCTTSALLSFVIVISTVYMNFALGSSGVMKNYEASLSQPLREIYQKIVSERQSIYFQGYVIGFVLSTIYLLYNAYVLHHRIKTFGSVFIVIVISYITNHLYYMLMPKTDNMLNHLETKEQIAAWNAMYNYMKYQFHLSFLFGIVGVAAYAYAFC